MTHSSRTDKWPTLESDEKLDALRDDIGKLYNIVEELSHKHHVFTDALQLVQKRLEQDEKSLNLLQKRTTQPEYST